MVAARAATGNASGAEWCCWGGCCAVEQRGAWWTGWTEVEGVVVVCGAEWWKSAVQFTTLQPRQRYWTTSALAQGCMG